MYICKNMQVLRKFENMYDKSKLIKLSFLKQIWH